MLQLLSGRNGRTVLLLLALTGGRVCAQDTHFSQFFETPLLRNPSFAGLFNGDYRVQGVYRDQWTQVTDAYRTGSFNAEYKMPAGSGNNFLTVGMEALFDRSGTVGLTTTEIFPALNYHKSLSDERNVYLSVGFMGGLVDKSIDRSKMTTNNQYDGTAFNPSLGDGETFATPTVHYLDGSIGMSLSSDFGQEEGNSFFVGAAMHHLNRPKNSFYEDANELKVKYVFSGGMKFQLGEESYFTIQADHTRQASFAETIGGFLYSYKLGDNPEVETYTLHMGAFLRWQDALVPVIKIDMNRMAIALSYDVNVSPLRTVSQGRGGVELSIAYVGFTGSNSSKYKTLCPRF
jgi:type IX secretion system PorP/SprF family membrane protein